MYATNVMCCSRARTWVWVRLHLACVHFCVLASAWVDVGEHASGHFTWTSSSATHVEPKRSTRRQDAHVHVPLSVQVRVLPSRRAQVGCRSGAQAHVHRAGILHTLQVCACVCGGVCVVCEGPSPGSALAGRAWSGAAAQATRR